MALLVRSVWLEGAERYHRLFADRPPTIVAQFCERVPMVKSRWDPDASTTTSYAWFMWSTLAPAPGETRLVLIPPGQRSALTKRDDRARFAAWSLPPAGEALPLFIESRPGQRQNASEPC